MNPIQQLKNLSIRKTMNIVEINKSIMELNFKKEKLQNEVDGIQEQIKFLSELRQRMTDNDYQKSGQKLFDEMFGSNDDIIDPAFLEG